MRASPLRHRLKIYEQSMTRSPTGAPKAGHWRHVLTIWGHFAPLSVKDIIIAQTAQVNISARAKIRHRKDIKHDMRIEYDGIMYEIVGAPLADDVCGKKWLTLMLKKVS